MKNEAHNTESETNRSETMTHSATATLGITWDDGAKTVDAGNGPEPMVEIDLNELRADIEAWREAPIEGDREAESDWAAFTAAVQNAARAHRD